MLQNEMEKMEDEMGTGIVHGFIGFRVVMVLHRAICYIGVYRAV